MRISLDSLAHTNPPMTVRDAIVSAVRRGVFPWVAAEAAGVSHRRFCAWLRSKKPPYRQFALDLLKARGWARLAAEMALYEKDPRSWLKCGPGRDLVGRPGWSKDVAAQLDRHGGRQAASLTNPAWQKLLARMLEALTPYPEARAALAQFLRAKQEGPRAS